MPKAVHARVVSLPPSRWPAELSEGHDSIVEALDEPDSMTHLLTAMKQSWALMEVDLSNLSRYEQAHEQKMPREFFFHAPVSWERLIRLSLGRSCVQADSGPDEHHAWDVQYLIDAIPLFKSLRVLELRDLELDADMAWDILTACSRSSTLKELDLGDNCLERLDAVVDDDSVVCGLDTLKLDSNVLGEFDDDSVGSDLTCHGLASVLTQYTSLTHLDLSRNQFFNREGMHIVAALGACTHLRTLDLSRNSWDPVVDACLRAAWRGPAEGLLL
jgi:hypothetical protein